MPEGQDPQLKTSKSGATFAKVILPVPHMLFKNRAARCHELARDNPLAPYLSFLGEVSAVQATVAARLPAPRLAAASDYALAPLPRNASALTADLHEMLDLTLELLAGVVMPDPSETALSRLRSLSKGDREAEIEQHLHFRGVTEADALAETLALHGFIGAALQVHFSRLAAQLPADGLSYLGDDLCPACGAPPACSILTTGTAPTRYVLCACCSTAWQVMRVKCINCGSIDKLHYSYTTDDEADRKAECCGSCNSYLKIFNVAKNPKIDAMADDVASSGLDLLVQKEGYHRVGVNIFLAGL